MKSFRNWRLVQNDFTEVILHSDAETEFALEFVPIQHYLRSISFQFPLETSLNISDEIALEFVPIVGQIGIVKKCQIIQKTWMKRISSSLTKKDVGGPKRN